MNRSLWLSFGLVAFSVLGHGATLITCTPAPIDFIGGVGTQTITCPAIDAGVGNTIGSLQLLLASDYTTGPIGTTSGTQINVVYTPSANFGAHTESVFGGFSSGSSQTDGNPNTPGGPWLAQTINLSSSRTLPSFTVSATSSIAAGGPVSNSTGTVFLEFTAVPEQISITCPTTSLSSGEIGAPFSSGPITVIGGIGTLTFSVATGAIPTGLTLNTATGAVTGTPTAAGSFTLKVTDSIGAVSNTCPFTIVGGPILTCPAAGGSFEVGVFVNSPAMVVTGGTGPYTFSVATGTLPTGLTLNTLTGAITGTPTATGSFTIQVKDSLGSTATTTCQFTVSPGPSLTCPAVGTFEVGEIVNSPAMSVTGGVGPYTFSVATGTLPTGLTLNTLTGAITGTPTATGTFTIQVKDSNGAVAVTTCPFTVIPGPSLTCPTTTSGEVGLAFNSLAIVVTGGTGPFTFSVASGTLPMGLTLNTSNGAITGTPTAAGSFTIEVTDSLGVVSTVNCPFTIVPPPSLNCPAVEIFEVGVPVNSPAIMVTGGVGPFTFSVATGTLPNGLTLDPSSGAITGTPAAAGTFTIQATDSNGIVSSNTCPFTVNVPANATVLIRYAANLNIGESYIDITNTGANGAPILGPGLGATVGNVCVNLYAFDPNEELISCCSCLVTADQTVNLGVKADLINRTETSETPNSVTVKLLTTLAGVNGSGTSCSYSAGTATQAALVGGVAAWGTTLHMPPGGGAYRTTETPFIGTTLNPDDLASTIGRCASIIGNASGAGICSSCRLGAL